MSAEPISSQSSEMPSTVRVARHALIDRAFHWLMAIAMFVLLATAFLPILGWRFEWIDIHWITGLLLTAIIVLHIIRALFFQDWRSMTITPTDVSEIVRGAGNTVTRAIEPPPLPGKYTGLQKLFHLGIALLVLAIIVSGLLMMFKIDTPFWRRNPYILTNYWWGIIYAVHGLAAMATVFMIMIHVYFALRPDEWYLTRSMIRGWISRKEFDAHHDPRRWKP